MTSEVSSSTAARDDAGRPAHWGRVVAWSLWDWAVQPFNTVIITFVFVALYLTSDAFIDPELALLPEGDAAREAALSEVASNLAFGVTIAGVLVALLAPVLGQRADTSGRRKAWLGVSTIAVIACMLGLFFVEADPAYFLLAVVLIGIGSVFGEIGGVHYNALLAQVSTRENVGRVSGLGWGLGYLGGIVALVIVVVADGADWWGLDTSNGLAYRLIALGCALWAIAFAWPIFAFVPEAPAAGRPKVSLVGSYVRLWRDLRALWHDSRPTLWFLVASAIYRDGLAGVFTFGAIIAARAYHFSDQEVVIFGIAANLVAGLATIIAGRVDDWVGPRRLIIWSLAGMILAGFAVAFLHDLGSIVFWVAGLVLCLFVGPVQSASRSLLARVSPQGKEGEIFGLYATTGRAVSFLAPAMYGVAIAITGAVIWGVLGIIAVVALGLVAMLFVRIDAR
ncbi:MFS transporter [Demequina silvatica]|uniref:MFS transporter n=1 Tax=Demequina silvatica TaxID=1638988 RepID=UPI00078049CE|nr:MFS transporter [Demequina silvatica]